MLYYPDFVIFLAKYLLWIMFGVTLFLGIKNRNFLINSVIAILVTRILVSGIKLVFMVDRPFISNPNLIPLVKTSDTSFPSVHAAIGASIALMIGIYFPKLIFPAFVLAILISIGRILVLVHYPQDVIIGFLIGLCISWTILKFRKVL